ncbi:MAG: hypothetical protein SPG17_04395 [Schaalia hyovaginalis]|uniref:hypothetical protein n=1 Tax=Schaalia hyovaginalis TaxID=29316 RepID=UPI0023F85BA5|nr:hypothetical protein [Schaalia hyovaginalis]MCI7671018.1 hypothetical protein [Schaalia hyovaginalis]MDY5506078.1 hypothetical protein [Schaalia hyovaginalis]
MTTSGSPEFDKFKRYIESNPAVRRELEFAFAKLLVAASPSDRGARFLFGGAAEWILAASAWCAGILVAPAGHNANGFDLADLLAKARTELWSVKASASASPGDIRLVNFQGTGENCDWTEPTLFVGPYVEGGVLVDPLKSAAIKKHMKRTGDSLAIRGRAIVEYKKTHPENHVAFDVAVNTGDIPYDSAAFPRSILDPATFPNLAKPFMAAKPVRDTSTSAEIERLVVLRDQGVLSEEQLAKAVALIID